MLGAREAKGQLAEYQGEIDDIAYGLYGVGEVERRDLEWSLARAQPAKGVRIPAVDRATGEPEEEDDTADVEEIATDTQVLAADLVSYAVGCCFGRWDIRIGRDPDLAPPLAGPFDPLPVCAPGMLVGPDGLPARSGAIVSEAWLRARPGAGTLPPGAVEPPTIPDDAYRLRVRWTGLLVDDPDHPDDIVRCVGEVFEVLFGERAEAFLAEACGLLGVRDLREYFRNPRGFFAAHLRRYSKKPRKAPIDWLLQSPRRHYAVWLYYPRLDGDLLWKALQSYVDPKIRREEQRLVEMRAQKEQATDARARRQAERAVERQEEVVADITEFRRRLLRVAELHLQPNLDDGVPLNAAPLHELMPWPEAGRFWKELVPGRYPWSHVGAQIRERLRAGAKLP